jgi:hypothetical protein
LRDPELMAEAERFKLNIGPISGAALRSMILESYRWPAKLMTPLNQLTTSGS